MGDHISFTGTNNAACSHVDLTSLAVVEGRPSRVPKDKFQVERVFYFFLVGDWELQVATCSQKQHSAKPVATGGLLVSVISLIALVQNYSCNYSYS